MIWCLAWSSSDSCLCFFAEPFVYRRELEGVACRPNDVRQLALDEPAQVLGSSAKRCRRCSKVNAEQEELKESKTKQRGEIVHSTWPFSGAA